MKRRILISLLLAAVLGSCQSTTTDDLIRRDAPATPAKPAAKQLPDIVQQAVSNEDAQKSPTAEDELFAAIGKGQLKEVKRLISAGVDVNAEDIIGDTPLGDAAAMGHLEIAEALLNAGADVDDGNPLLRAAGAGQREMVQLLLARGADVDQPDDRPDGGLGDALNYAAYAGNSEIVSDLIQAGASLSTRDMNGDTALINAAHRKRSKVVEVLLKAGANVNTRGYQNCTALWYAASNGDLPMVRALLEAGADANASSADSESILLVAATHAEDAEMVELLLDHGARRHISRKMMEPYLHPESEYDAPSATLIEALNAAGYEGKTTSL